DYKKTTELFLLDLASERNTQDRRKKKRVHIHKVRATTGHDAERLHTSPPQQSDSITTIDSTTSEGNKQPLSTQSQPVLCVKKKRGSKMIKIYKGFKHTKSWAWTKNILYRYSTYRMSRWNGVLKITPHGEWRVVGDHKCRKNAIVYGSVRNETGAMKKMNDSLATEGPGMPEEAIWGLLWEEHIEGLTEEQVKAASAGYAADTTLRYRRAPRLRTLRPRSFISISSLPTRNRMRHPTVYWVGSPCPEGTSTLQQRFSCIDGTFKCVPRGFYQCLIVMVDDPARNMYTPVYFALCTSKTETMHKDILNLIHRDTGKKISP
ncbi:hypothetical protein GN958_ATG19957, partial [Phytophthora infestans]